jgi:hypothetical protein
MNIGLMVGKILPIANSVVGESSLPHFTSPSDSYSESVRIPSLDQLDGAFNCDLVGWSQEQMNMFRHEDECVQPITAIATVSVQGFQEQANVGFNHKQSLALPRCEGDEVRAGWRNQSYRLHGKPQRQKPRVD